MARGDTSVPLEEVDDIVSRRVASELAAREVEMDRMIADQVAKQMAAIGGGTQGNPQEWMQGLAMAIAGLTDQGSNIKRLSPEEVVKRNAAYDRMMELIKQAERNGQEPTYKLRHPVYLGERKINPIWIDRDHRQQPTEIGWFGPPSEAMDPVGQPAEDIYAAFCEWTGAVVKRDLGEIRVTAAGLTIVKGGPAIVEPQHTGAHEGRGAMVPTIKGRTAQGPRVETRILGTLQPAAVSSP